MQNVAGGNVVYPSLEEVSSLFRALINDTGNNTAGNGVGQMNQQGLIMPDSNPDLITFMSSAVRTLYSDLRNVGEPQLIIDNYNLIGLPPVNSVYGPGSPNPAVQVGLSYAGYFDGVQWYPQWTLPISTRRVLAVSERQAGTNNNFQPMKPSPFGIPSGMQGIYNQVWEMREGILWMPGSIQSMDLRIRARIGYPSGWNVATLNYQTTYIPILNCADAVVAKMLVRYAQRFAPEQYPMAKDTEKTEMDKLKLETVRQLQANENERFGFGDEATQDFSIAWSWL
jgi:hypothetical protein